MAEPLSTWQSTPILKGIRSLHVLVVLAFLLWPGHWLAWMLSLMSLHAFIVAMIFQPRNPFFGPNLTRLPVPASQRNEVAITFDDGPDALVTPQILDLLDRSNAKASFFVVGRKLLMYPELAKDIVRRGHTLENHTSNHPVFYSFFPVAGLRREVEAVQQGVSRICGQAPRFFRPPAGFHSPLLIPLLGRLGLRLATWTRRGFDTRDGNAQRVLNRLTRNLSAGDILLLHDGNAARDPDGAPVVLRVLPQLLHELQARGLRTVTLPQALLLPTSSDAGLGP